MPKRTKRPTLAEALRREVQIGTDLESLAGLMEPKQAFEVFPTFEELTKRASDPASGFVRIPIPHESR